MNIIQSQKGLISILMIGGAIASSGGYAFAQKPIPLPTCIPSPINPCTVLPSETLTPKKPHPKPRILPPQLVREILKLYPQAIRELQKDEPHAVQKLRQGDPATLQKLQQLAPDSTLQLQPYLQQLRQQPQQLNQPIIRQQLR
jgi:hypothetical protein